jgi:hypothetical protein
VAEQAASDDHLVRNPQVLHVGFSKCASTYLRSLFRSHPDVHLVFKSGYFTPFLATDMTFAEYQRHFRTEPGVVNVESDEHLTLPGVHPSLGIRATNLEEFAAVAERVGKELPRVRILMVIRNQASLMVSRYSEYLITGGSLGFDKFADELLGPGSGNNQWFQNYYRRVIGILEDRFPPEQLLVLLQESMRDDVGATSDRIAGFMGLRRGFEARDGLRSERRSLSLAGMRILAALNGRMVSVSSIGSQPPTTRVPQFVFRNVVRAVRALDYYLISRLSPKASAIMSHECRRRILQHFRDDNLALQEHLKLDLAKLGYLESR